MDSLEALKKAKIPGPETGIVKKRIRSVLSVLRHTTAVYALM